MRISGADEAGKGPVLGPLVVAAVAMERDLLEPEYRDSKRVPPGERERLAGRIRSRGRCAVAVKDPHEIDDRGIDTVLREGYVEALTRLDYDEAYADAADVKAERFEDFLRREVGGEITAEHGADDSYPVVAAASIVAKVERDRLVDEIADRLGADVGSGYPADPATTDFLERYVEENGELPGCARKSWETSRRVLARAAQSGLGDF